MPLDSFIDLLRRPFKRPAAHGDRPGKQTYAVGGGEGPSTSADDDRAEPPVMSPPQPQGHFHNAHNFVLNNPTIAETVNYMISTGKTVLEYLLPYTLPDAAMDSSARHPPPKCHPGTRLHIGNKLKGWLCDSKRSWSMIWLHGSAGTGKSAVAQTFAECCAEWGRLGAAYFFSRSNKRNRSETVVPSLVYQLAVAVPEYKSIIADKLANDPQLLEKAAPVQFKKLIVEPFLTLQRQHPREPLVIILDGLDECKGKNAQLEIIDMITETIRLHPDLPLLWLICSRPEAHLKHAFSRVADCGREELIIDAECRDDVERYLREGIAEMKAKYWDVTPSDWPSEEQLKELFDRVSGLFVLASTVLKHMDNPTLADPVGQLDHTMSCLRSARAAGSSNPLATLDVLYTQILNDIPGEVFPITWRILAHLMYIPPTVLMPFSAQEHSNFLRLEQRAFYSALRGLHSVLDIPEPGVAIRTRLEFHHTSFQDFLLDPNRSGKFFIDKQKALVDVAKSTLFWYEVGVSCFHTSDGWEFDSEHKHDNLPRLTWTSIDNHQTISQHLLSFASWCTWDTIIQSSRAAVDDDLLFQLYNFDFRYANGNIWNFANWLFKEDLSDTLVRTEPCSPTDFQLLEYFKLVINNGFATPAMLPLDRYQPWTRQYLFLGRGVKSGIAWITIADGDRRTYVLNAEQEPTEKIISRYQEDLKYLEWEESKVDRFADVT